LGLTYILFRRPRPDFWGGLQEVLGNAFYLDRGYLRFIARPYQRLAGGLWQDVDEGGVDRGVEATAGSLKILSACIGRWTTGRLSTYLTMLFLGLTVMFVVLALSWNW
jgi:NADH:ubiquinone oxidoreductase subunit 5 (subunit L)/multisubunit Na+/H+ antiporter MnhA subunit